MTLQNPTHLKRNAAGKLTAIGAYAIVTAASEILHIRRLATAIVSGGSRWGCCPSLSKTHRPIPKRATAPEQAVIFR